VTTEDDFQRALDKNLEDWQTRLVFADWLQDQGDSRAAGYRVLGTLRLYPKFYREHDEWTWWRWHGGPGRALYHMGPVWWDRLTDFKHHWGADKSYRTRRQAEDAAVRAFTQLTEADQVTLISGYQP
jgi:uncharacterized protein (TIGR02996 family)